MLASWNVQGSLQTLLWAFLQPRNASGHNNTLWEASITPVVCKKWIFRGTSMIAGTLGLLPSQANTYEVQAPLESLGTFEVKD